MLGEFGDEIQSVEDLEVACDPRGVAEEAPPAGFGKRRQAFFSAR